MWDTARCKSRQPGCKPGPSVPRRVIHREPSRECRLVGAVTTELQSVWLCTKLACSKRPCTLWLQTTCAVPAGGAPSNAACAVTFSTSGLWTQGGPGDSCLRNCRHQQADDSSSALLQRAHMPSRSPPGSPQSTGCKRITSTTADVPAQHVCFGVNCQMVYLCSCALLHPPST